MQAIPTDCSGSGGPSGAHNIQFTKFHLYSHAQYRQHDDTDNSKVMRSHVGGVGHKIAGVRCLQAVGLSELWHELIDIFFRNKYLPDLPLLVKHPWADNVPSGPGHQLGPSAQVFWSLTTPVSLSMCSNHLLVTHMIQGTSQFRLLFQEIPIILIQPPLVQTAVARHVVRMETPNSR